MEPLLIGSLLNAGVNLLGGIFGAAGAGEERAIQLRNMQMQKDIAERNLSMQYGQYQWEKEAQQKTWEREDTAIARRIADLKASGLSPTLAAGSAAQTSSPIAVHAPQKQFVPEPGVMDKNAFVMSMISQAANIARTFSENQLLTLQQERAKADTAKSLLESGKIIKDTEASELHNQRFAYETDFYRRNKITSTSSTTFKDIAALLEIVTGGQSEGSPYKKAHEKLKRTVVDASAGLPGGGFWAQELFMKGIDWIKRHTRR